MFLSLLFCGASAKHVHGHHKHSLNGGSVLKGFKLTGYYPDDSPMEGGYYDCLDNPLRTLQDYQKGKVSYVSIAVDKNVIPLKSIVNIDGFTCNGKPVKFWACDVGGAIKNYHIDICVANEAETYKVDKSGVTVTVYGKTNSP
jgi:3D (Asp-Asp-Asp) domain-containing protein